jgi:hypothetical protein
VFASVVVTAADMIGGGSGGRNHQRSVAEDRGRNRTSCLNVRVDHCSSTKSGNILNLVVEFVC